MTTELKPGTVQLPPFDRFELFEEVGRGNWGIVHKAQDKITKQTVAIKYLDPSELAIKQMGHRDLTEFSAMSKEATILAPCSHVVPRSFEVDSDGNPFIVMPFYKRFLKDELYDDKNNRHHIGYGINSSRGISYIKDIAEGIAELHEIIGIVHGDIKPDNLAIDHKRISIRNGVSLDKILLTDLGASTCASYGWSESPRDNVGFLNTRAPELFNEESHPTKRSDTYSWAALAFRIFSGKYPFEDQEIPTVSEDFDKAINKMVRKNIPRKFREIIKRNLSYNPWNRSHDGVSVSESLDNIIENMGAWNNFKKHTKRAFLYVAPTVGTISALIYGVETHEPIELNMPDSRITGLLYPEIKEEERIEFDSENLDLPGVAYGMIFGGQAQIAKQSTDNRIVAYLLKTHGQAAVSGGLKPYTNFQQSLYIQYQIDNHISGETYPGKPWAFWTKSIEYALNQSKKDWKVDLEDVCAISRVGPELVSEAKRISDNVNWKVYQNAKYENGNQVIPKREQTFINYWLAYFHADI